MAFIALPATAFPADQAMVPVAVGAAFALPALAALAYYTIARFIALIGRIASLVVLVLVCAGMAEMVSPGLARPILDLVGLRWGT